MAKGYTTAFTTDRDDDGDGYQTYRSETIEMSLLSKDRTHSRHHWTAQGASRVRSARLSKKSQFRVYGQMAVFFLSGKCARHYAKTPVMREDNLC